MEMREHILNNVNLLRVNLDPLIMNYEVKKLTNLNPKNTLLKIEIDLKGTKVTKGSLME